MKKLIANILYSNLFISICAVSLSVLTYMILGEAINFSVLFLIFFATFFIYNINIFFTEKTDTDREIWRYKNKNSIRLLLPFSLIGICIPSIHLPSSVLFLLGGLGLLSILYTVPIPFIRIALRKIPYLKIFLIALVWSAVTILLPVMDLGSDISSQKNVLLLAERFIFVLSICIPFDIRDYKYDKEKNLLTIPGLLGIERSKNIALLLLAAYLLISFLHYDFSTVFTSRLIASVLTALLIYKINTGTKDSYYLGLIDGTMLMQCITFWILSSDI